jgi:hypothetical protein
MEELRELCYSMEWKRKRTSHLVAICEEAKSYGAHLTPEAPPSKRRRLALTRGVARALACSATERPWPRLRPHVGRTMTREQFLDHVHVVVPHHGQRGALPVVTRRIAPGDSSIDVIVPCPLRAPSECRADSDGARTP